jgi:4-amino-4-deoxy-L-arabinose transferase-like glycosyltransferase
VRRPGRWSTSAWGAIALVVAFIAVTWWWVSRDLGVPSGDAASHLYTAVAYYELIANGDFAAFWTRSGYYPPLTFVVGGLGAFVGAVNVGAPVVAQNVVYVSLLAAGCYGTGRLVAGSRAGFLAVVFALGSPLLIEQFHVFMIDAPEAAMVALSVWLVLLSDRFARVGVASLAGLAVGLGFNSKEQFPLFLAGLLLVVLLRGGWRHWRGLIAFGGVAAVVALPWYAINWEVLDEYARAGLANANLPPRGKPPLVSVANLGWYLWATLNGLLFAPLCAFAAVGVGDALVKTVRAARASFSASSGHRPELLGGLLGGWLAITLTPHHDMRYTMPLIVYLAVLGTAWIVALSRPARLLATAALALAVTATTLGATFGVGGDVKILLAGRPVVTNVILGIPPPKQITVYADHDFLVSAPRREVDMPGFMEALRAEGVTGLAWEQPQFPVRDTVADLQGLILLGRFAGLAFPEPGFWDYADPDHAFLIRRPSSGSAVPPCLTLADGSGIWVVRGQVPGGEPLRYFCPGL